MQSFYIILKNQLKKWKKRTKLIKINEKKLNNKWRTKPLKNNILLKFISLKKN